MSALIEARGLTRVLPETVPVTLVKDVSLAIEAGQVVVVHEPRRHLVPDVMLHRRATAMVYCNVVQRWGEWRAVHHVTPRLSAASTPERQPSSWKPQPW